MNPLDRVGLMFSELTNKVYLGIGKPGRVWTSKRDITNEFIRTIVAWIEPGEKREFHGPNGTIVIEVRLVPYSPDPASETEGS